MKGIGQPNASAGLTLSVLVPVFNEKPTLDDVLERVLRAPLPREIAGMEIVAVDDGSTDGSGDVLARAAAADPRIRVFRHERNRGKGAALRTAIREARGDVALFQDADLEYDPADYVRLLKPILEQSADVVYGSRFASSEYRRILLFWHSLGNRLLTGLSNMLNDFNLTDMETGYKAFRMSVLKTIPLRSNRFGIEPEITAKIAKRRLTLYEVPVSYAGRTYAEGKKIKPVDALAALWTTVKYWLIDDLYEERYGEDILRSMERAERFTQWLIARLDPYLQGTVLEVGAGIGNNVRALLHKDRIIATEPDPEYVRLLQNAFGGRQAVDVRQWDVTCPAPAEWDKVDSILCSNVLEHVDDDVGALRNMKGALKDGGHLVLVVPAGARLHGSLDRALGHRRRYSTKALRDCLARVGLGVETLFSMNKPGVLGWYFNGIALRRTKLGRVQMKLFNGLVPLFKILDPVLPWTGLSLVVVARKRD